MRRLHCLRDYCHQSAKLYVFHFLPVFLHRNPNLQDTIRLGFNVQTAEIPTYPVMCPFLHFLLYYVITINQRSQCQYSRFIGLHNKIQYCEEPR